MRLNYVKALRSELANRQLELSLLQKRNEALRVRMASLLILLRSLEELEQYRACWSNGNKADCSTSSSLCDSSNGSSRSKASTTSSRARLPPDSDDPMAAGSCLIDDVPHLTDCNLLKLDR